MDMSVTLSHDQVRTAILELLHQYAQKEPTGEGIPNNSIAEKLGVPQNIADFNLKYLREKNLVRFWRVTGGGYYLQITALGCDVVEHKDKFTKDFPFVEVTIQNQNIQGDAYGVVQASGHTHVSVTQQDAFKQAYSVIDKSQLTAENKASLLKDVMELERELQKRNKADTDVILKLWLKIKENANWLIPTLVQAVTEGIKVAIGSP